MDLEKIGTFLALLRRERGLTQEQLGQTIGVTNKTVSRWEKGNYLPPAEMLRALSELYGVSINELLSGERLGAEEYPQKAEENITAVLEERGISLGDRIAMCGQWLRKNWWLVVICLLPAVGMAVLLPHVHMLYQRGAMMLVVWLLFLGCNVVVNHLVFHVSRAAFRRTGQEREYWVFRVFHGVWTVLLIFMVLVCVDTLLALAHVLTPAGTADGYHIISIFNDWFIPQAGIYPDRCFETLQYWLWRAFGVWLVRLDLGMLWMKK